MRRKLGCPTSNGVIGLNKWSLIGFTYDGSNLKIYINGLLDKAMPETGNLPYSADPLVIGESSMFLWPFQGSIADVQIYNASLSQQQVSRLYQNGAFAPPVSSQNLRLWMPLDGNPDDFSGAFYSGVQSTGVNYTYSGYTPPKLSNAYQTSRAAVPLTLTANGLSRLYNVSVVTWR